MDLENDMIFRYDNTKHHPKINTFPHHKHFGNDILPCQKPDLSIILKEIKEYYMD